ncbi:MAG: DUF1801 domain-containing protein [Ignavibacteriae bacterium]|nr:DUF1801 domain-containing protein [Ignavibacteriota bacterium]
MNYSKAVSDYINFAPSDQFEILETLRKLIHTNVKNVSEAIKWNMPVFSNPKNFCYLQSTKNHVTLGFYNPERINDSANLLEGTGKVMKHVKIKSKDEINTELFSKWLKIVSS